MAKKKKQVKKKSKGIFFPKNLLIPVGKFLQSQIKILERRKKKIETEDPFVNESRILDNASPDADAAEQFGHAKTSAIKKQMDRKIVQTKKALTRVRLGKYGICDDCGEMIDTDRLTIYPEATFCVKCEAKREK